MHPSEREPTGFARLFVGLWPGAAVRDALEAQRRAWVWPPAASLIPPECLHLTLHFLGAVKRERLAELVQWLGVRFEPIELALALNEVWSGGVAVLRPATTPAGLQALNARLGRALQAFGASTALERLVPHVALARRALGAVPPVEAVPLRWLADRYVLVESGLPPPQRYRVVAEYA